MTKTKPMTLCYACDAQATGSRTWRPRPYETGDIKPACARHRDDATVRTT
jgi:hypothetical protein